MKLIGWEDLHYDEMKAALDLVKMSQPTSVTNYRKRVCLARKSQCKFCPFNHVTDVETKISFCHLISHGRLKITWREVAELFRDEIERRDKEAEANGWKLQRTS